MGLNEIFYSYDEFNVDAGIFYKFQGVIKAWPPLLLTIIFLQKHKSSENIWVKLKSQFLNNNSNPNQHTKINSSSIKQKD